ECESVGNNYYILEDEDASNEAYVMVKPGFENSLEAPTDDASAIVFPFTIDSAGIFSIIARVNCPSKDTCSYWAKIDDGTFELTKVKGTGFWQWEQFINTSLEEGEHSLTISFQGDEAKLDKINISDFLYAPAVMGKESGNICEPEISDTSTVVGINSIKTNNGYSLNQNYPNPVSETALITFTIPIKTYVSLKVFNMLGIEVAELGGKIFSSGKHTVEFNPVGLPQGYYFYKIKAEQFSATRKMTIIEK
ncbi:MAG: T9SS type A sorting domain-containing protein, partial [Bacteroidales bacterium]|nr:T9SS type A sorting domain-containing protein [Bacteroidales bacterium]